jgi:hypothetical protein
VYKFSAVFSNGLFKLQMGIETHQANEHKNRKQQSSTLFIKMHLITWITFHFVVKKIEFMEGAKDLSKARDNELMASFLSFPTTYQQ